MHCLTHQAEANAVAWVVNGEIGLQIISCKIHLDAQAD